MGHDRASEPTSALGHSRPCRASSYPGHVRYYNRSRSESGFQRGQDDAGTEHFLVLSATHWARAIVEMFGRVDNVRCVAAYRDWR